MKKIILISMLGLFLSSSITFAVPTNQANPTHKYQQLALHKSHQKCHKHKGKLVCKKTAKKPVKSTKSTTIKKTTTTKSTTEPGSAQPGST